MLEQVLDYIHNYIIDSVHSGKVSISGGVLDVDFLKHDQFYYIKGSVFNDGLHQFKEHVKNMRDEDFAGEVWAMAVPPAVIAISGEIDEWVAEYGKAIDSPYQSESFGGYSYTKSTGNAEKDRNMLSWQDKFGHRLDRWRKIA